MAKIIKFISRHYIVLLYFAVIGSILFLNSIHFSYPDEFDNILGGKLILQGRLPYSGFFSHHGPLSYFIAAIFGLIAKENFVQFRIMTAGFLFGLFVIAGIIFNRRINKYDKRFLAGLGIFLTIGMSYYWGHMFLADSICALFLLIAYVLVFLKIYHKEKLQIIDLVIISVLTSACLLTSFTYVYAVFVLSFISAISFLRFFLPHKKLLVREFIKFLVIFAIPYLFFIAYLFISNSWREFYFQTIYYNQNYYITNYPRAPGSDSFNPIRYAVVIFAYFVDHFQEIIVGLKIADLRFPLSAGLGASNLFLWIFLLVKKRFQLLILAIFTLVYVSVRSNPAVVNAIDYQNATYITLSFFHASFLIWVLFYEWDKIKNSGQKLILTIPALVFIVYAFFSAYFLGAEAWRIHYGSFMGQLPLIYNRPQIAPFVNQLVPKDHYCWIGPFEFEELYYLECKLPSKYHWVLPQFGGIKKIQTEMLADFSSHKPDIIIFQKGFAAFGADNSFNEFLMDFMDRNYLEIRDYEGGKYRFATGLRGNFDLEQAFNVRKDISTEVFQKLILQGQIIKR